MLTGPYVEEEVISALKGMGLVKASGIDGFPALFFQKYWHILDHEVNSFCLRVLIDDKDLGVINVTNIALIPKIQNPTSMANFHPISLCNVIYKIIAKMIANRFQELNDYINSS